MKGQAHLLFYGVHRDIQLLRYLLIAPALFPGEVHFSAFRGKSGYRLMKNIVVFPLQQQVIGIVLRFGLVFQVEIVGFQPHYLLFESIVDVIACQDKEIVFELFYLVHIAPFEPDFHKYFLHNFPGEAIVFHVEHGYFIHLPAVMTEQEGIGVPVTRGHLLQQIMFIYQGNV